MKNPHRWQSLALFGLVLGLDQISKHSAPKELLYYNEGFIFGSMSDLPQTLRIITLCSLGGFIFTAYLFLIALLPQVLRSISLGLGIFIGGVFGNIVDRAFLGKTIDFIPLHFQELSLVFNLADVFQWAGAIIITIKLIKKEKIIWFPENQRGKIIVLFRDQMYLASKVTLSCFCCALLLGLFSLTFLRFSLMGLSVEAGATGLVLRHFALAFGSLSILFCLLIFLLSLYLSHKMAGPLYAFELYVEELLSGVNRPLKLREGDQSKHLEKIAEDLRKSFHKE